MTADRIAPPQLRSIPSIDQLLRSEKLADIRATVGIKRLTNIARLVTKQMRNELEVGGGLAGDNQKLATPETLTSEAESRIRVAWNTERMAGIRHVINATGVVLHTNLGRAPLSASAVKAIGRAARYCSLEYDVTSGSRGTRGERVELLLQEVTGAEDALVVNNCAAAALLILTVIAGDGETIVSRGELVEIGGDFRVPDIMASSGTRMIEVGTTNRTHLSDYRKAINGNTRLLMRVHPSNYRIVGFAGTPLLSELADLARATDLPLYEDAGSGQLSDQVDEALAAEPSVVSRIRQGADLVSFSGDKLLGSVQAGLIVGKKRLVESLRRHPLYRALRSDKIRLAALEATLASHLGGKATDEVPILQMLAATEGEIHHRSKKLLEQCDTANSGLQLELVTDSSTVGGGAAPGSSIATTVVALTHQLLSASELEQRLRSAPVPIISRITDDKVLIDLRTVFPDEETLIATALNSLLV